MTTTSIHAQTVHSPRIDNPDPFADMRERRNREAALRGAEIVPGKVKDDPRQTQVIFDQLKEDFRSLQLIRNAMVRALKTEKKLNYKNLVGETSELHKRASRLKAIKALNSIDAAKNQITSFALDERQMKNALVNLCNGIITFIESPVLFRHQIGLRGRDIYRA